MRQARDAPSARCAKRAMRQARDAPSARCAKRAMRQARDAPSARCAKRAAANAGRALSKLLLAVKADDGTRFRFKRAFEADIRPNCNSAVSKRAWSLGCRRKPVPQPDEERTKAKT
jgi:hypothetical protein